MVVSVPLHYGRDLSASTVEAGGVGEALHAALSKHYASDHFVTVRPLATDPHPHLSPFTLALARTRTRTPTPTLTLTLTLTPTPPPPPTLTLTRR